MDPTQCRRRWLRHALRTAHTARNLSGNLFENWPIQLGMAVALSLIAPSHGVAQQAAADHPAPTTASAPPVAVGDGKDTDGVASNAGTGRKPEQSTSSGVVVLRFRMSAESEAAVNAPLAEAEPPRDAGTSTASKRTQVVNGQVPASIPAKVVAFTQDSLSDTEPVESDQQVQTDKLTSAPEQDEPPRLQASARIKWLGTVEKELAESSGGVADDRQSAGDAIETDSSQGAAPLHRESGSGPTECPGAPDHSRPLRLDAEPGAEGDESKAESHPFDAPTADANLDEEPDTRGAPVFSLEEIRLRDRIIECLDYFQEHPENVVRRGPWALMHTILPFGAKTEIVAGSRKVNAIGWLCYNGVSARQRMFQQLRNGFKPNVGPGMQGHEGQFLAILAQSRVPSDFPLKIGGRMYTVQDLVRYEMATCRERSELTFKLIGLSYYLDQDVRWRDNRGRTWNLEKVLVEEMAQPVNGAACGGTHRLMALSYAVIRRNKAGYELTGNWAKAEQYLNDYVDYTMKLQNSDGSFSTRWFEGRGVDPDIERKVQTTGHIAEWLVFTLPDEHLRSDRMRSAIQFLADAIGDQPDRDWSIGPRGHALRAMALYNQRVFGVQPGEPAEPDAEAAHTAEPTSRRIR